MATIREVYFAKLPIVKNNKNLSEAILRKLLIKFNNFKDELDLTKSFDSQMSNESLFNHTFNRIKDGIMFEYAINESIFDNNVFYVDENVLIPRQETEELVNHFYDCISKLKFDINNLNIADVCTGSGCIGISIKKKFSNANLYLTDNDINALKVVNKNLELNKIECKVLQGNMLQPLIKEKVKLDCIVCNPPYIENIKEIDKRTWDQEPHNALLAKPCTKYYEKLLSKASKVLNSRYLIALEIGEQMKKEISLLIKKYFPYAKVEFIKDLSKKWRFVFIYSQNRYKTAAESLKKHGVIGFPTETVMGLGVVYDDKIAFDKLNEIKRRPENKPYSLMLSSIKEISKYAYLSKKEKAVAKAFLPGPLTLLLKKKKLPKWVTFESDYVGIRIPDIYSIRRVIKSVGKPILAPSANRSGEQPALTNLELYNIFGNELDFVIKGDAMNSKPSTIVLIDEDVKIIREGPISKQQILEVIGNENRNRK